ncbi:unnamed protein product [Mytilus coruscus]|uniref:Uncharacterized protein n=1 Tax=Mytilus coruscus TaxID=42192 RepID=A0A6J8DJU2_MYTCO|nr:unnamed protein product [Mytilus coruscus]
MSTEPTTTQLVQIGVRIIMKEERCYLPDGTILEMKEVWTSDQPTSSPTEESNINISYCVSPSENSVSNSRSSTPGSEHSCTSRPDVVVNTINKKVEVITKIVNQFSRNLNTFGDHFNKFETQLQIINEKVERLENLTESLLNSNVPKVNNDCSCEHTISNVTNDLCGHSESNQLSYREPVYTKTIGYTKPSIYDGTTNWLEYKLHFEAVAKLNNWSEDIKVLKLITCMNDAALSTLADIEIDNIPTYSNLVRILTKRFAPENLTDVYMSQIDACIRKPGQPLQLGPC